MNQRKKKVRFFGLPLPSRGWFWAAILASVFLHFFSYVNLNYFGDIGKRSSMRPNDKGSVKVRIVERPKPKNDENDSKKILEAPLEKTEAPDEARYKGAQDHKTDKETKVKPDPRQAKGQDPGHGGQDVATQARKKQQPASRPAQPSAEQQVPDPKDSQVLKNITDPRSSVLTKRRERKPRNRYESLMPGAKDLKRQVQAGYQDYVDDEVEVGDRIDLNTTNYRYIGYMTSVRKAFELVWTYPAEAARRGLQGQVRVEFTIMSDGRVKRIKVVETSGHSVLDEAVVEAIELSSPYSPLPSGKEQITVVGSFHYVLSSYAGAY
jgi:TonB family protein